MANLTGKSGAVIAFYSRDLGGGGTIETLGIEITGSVARGCAGLPAEAETITFQLARLDL
jgi:hypothetical protein